jgi:hypothetical protein
MHRVVRRGDQFVVFGFATYTMRDADAPLETLAAESWFFIPSADDDRVWLASSHPGSAGRRFAWLRSVKSASTVA